MFNFNFAMLKISVISTAETVLEHKSLKAQFASRLMTYSLPSYIFDLLFGKVIEKIFVK